MLELLGDDTEVPCLDGRPRRYVNLDYAASAPMLAAAWEAVEAFMPWYSSVHRGTGVKSQVATAAYEDARDDVAAFVGARADDDVVFVRNTTEAINVLSAALPAGTRVLSTPGRAPRQHAPVAPARPAHCCRSPRSADELLDAVRATSCARAAAIDLLAVTGASNVTGEVWPVAELAEIAHDHGAELFVDAAQLAPHRPIDMAASGIDYLALSGHKLYAPFGAGALVGAACREGEPLLHGGGAVELVTLDDVIWDERAGALRGRLAERRRRRRARAPPAARSPSSGWTPWPRTSARSPGACGRRSTQSPACGLTLWPEGSVDRVGVATFNLDGYRHPLLAAVLSAEHAIGVRHGCFCAHPLIARLLDVPHAEARPPARARSRAGGAAGAARRGAREHRARHHGRRHRPADRRARRHRGARAAAPLRVPAGPRRVPPGGRPPPDARGVATARRAGRARRR